MGHREIFIGLEVPQITTKFPYVNLLEADMVLKALAPKNSELNTNGPIVHGRRVPYPLGHSVSFTHPKV